MRQIKGNESLKVKPNVNVRVASDLVKLVLRKSENNDIEVNYQITLSHYNEGDDIPINIQYDEHENLFTCEVSIERRPFFRDSAEGDRLEIALPSVNNVTVDMENAAVEVHNLNGNFEIQQENGKVLIDSCVGTLKGHSENGGFKTFDFTGNIEIENENGGIVVEKCSGDTIDVHNENGSIKILESRFNKGDIENENGSVYYEMLYVQEGDFHIRDENGTIKLIIPDELEYDIHAITEMGQIKFLLNKDKTEYDYRKTDDFKEFHAVEGTGSVHFELENENGSVVISNDPKLMIQGVKKHFEELEDKMENFDIHIDTDSIENMVSNIAVTIEKTIQGLSNSRVKDSLEKAVNQLKDTTQDYVTKVKNDVAEDTKPIFNEIIPNIQNSFKNAKESVIRTITKAVQNNQEQPSKETNASCDEKNEDSTRNSRLKILELLEKGKISVEDAEKLLSALSK